MGERQNNVNPDVFSDQPESVREYWSSKTPSVCSLELSFEEVFYLYFKKNWIVVYEQSNALTAEDLWNVFTRENRSKLVEKLVVYSQLRDFGWCVRSGLTYGCQYLVYKECPSNYHASAGVFIKNATEPNHLVSLTRALTNVKKALIIATITFPTGFNLLTIDDLKNINVEFLTANTFFPERLENRETL
ncbi:unnamed protein product [Auanema sp. JU1783]|nr:unnamed protein product [Auanema sp. JU1783]